VALYGLVSAGAGPDAVGAEAIREPHTRIANLRRDGPG
jgi:hypothetical protein